MVLEAALDGSIAVGGYLSDSSAVQSHAAAAIQLKSRDIQWLPPTVERHRSINELIDQYNSIDDDDNNFKAHRRLLLKISQRVSDWNRDFARGRGQRATEMPAVEALSETVNAEILAVERQAGPRQLEEGLFFEKATPALKGSTKKDRLTEAGDVTALVHGAAATSVAVAKGAEFVGQGTEAFEAIGAFGELVGLVGIGLAVFGIAENAVRARDAKIRLATFTRAYEKLPDDDPVRPYLEEAARQQDWERKRRWVRVAVNTAILGLSIAALAVGTATTGGLVLAAVGGVLAIGKGIETVRNLWSKYKAKVSQQQKAEEILAGIGESEQKAREINLMLDGLGIRPISADDVEARNRRYRKARNMLAPHLGRAQEAHEEALQERAEEIHAGANEEADAIIRQLEQPLL